VHAAAARVRDVVAHEAVVEEQRAAGRDGRSRASRRPPAGDGHAGEDRREVGGDLDDAAAIVAVDDRRARAGALVAQEAGAVDRRVVVADDERPLRELVDAGGQQDRRAGPAAGERDRLAQRAVVAALAVVRSVARGVDVQRAGDRLRGRDGGDRERDERHGHSRDSSPDTTSRAQPTTDAL
jgi:hypothetical protein